MAWAVIHAPALQDSLENTVRGILMNACLGLAMPPAALTVCNWSMTTSVAVASDTQVQSIAVLVVILFSECQSF